MKNRISTIVLFISLSFHLFGQTHSKQDLIADLTYLNTAVINGHPVNYDPKTTVDILPIIELAKQIKTEQVTSLEYELWIEKGIYHIGCIHTNLRINPMIPKDTTLMYLPLKAEIQEDKLRITACIDQSIVGTEIESINEVQSSDIIGAYQEYKASDGATDAFSKVYFHLASSRLISRHLHYPDTYTIKTIDGEFELKPVDEIFTSKNKLEPASLPNNVSSYKIEDSYAILKVVKFKKGDNELYNDLFKALSTTTINILLIDLRHNGGGARKSAVELTKYLVDTNFSYSILQPKHLKLRKYLNGKGKFFLFLSKLKYNIGDIVKTRRSEYGTEFNYTFKPKKEYTYSGQIYVLTDGYTASSSTMVTSWLRQHSNAKFIGSQASGGYNGNNGGTFPLITLPQSQMVIRFPGNRLILDKNSNERAGIIPEVTFDKPYGYPEVIDLIKSK